MSHSHNTHWAQDEDLVEQFVLDRLQKPEVERLERHLAECPECRGIVGRERTLVAGIRRAGRDAVKHRLSQSIGLQKKTSINWYKVAGVAAGIVLLVTLGIYNKWFLGSDTSRDQGMISGKFEKRAEPSTPVPHETQPVDEAKQTPERDHRDADKKTEHMQNLAAGAPSKPEGEAAKVSELRADNFKELNAVGGGANAPATEKKDRLAASSFKSAAPEAWVQGTVIMEQNDNVRERRTVGANAEEAQGALRKGKEQAQAITDASTLRAAGGPTQPIVVNQQPSSALPVSQRVQQRGGFTIQTLLQKNPDGVHMTVFLDSLLSVREFQRAHAQSIGEDSIILNLGNQRVGYKLPPGWGGQKVQQSPTKK